MLCALLFGGKIPTKGNRTGKYVECRICGKKIYKTLSYLGRGNKHHYCSNECAQMGRHIDTHEKRVCEICGGEFDATKSSPKRFCSTKCQNEWQKSQIGPLNPHYSRIDAYCTWCGKKIKVNAYKSSHEHHFCNAQCRQAWYANVFSQSEDWINKSRIRAASILDLESGVISQTHSKPQQVVDDLLNKLHIRYEREYNLKYYAADNYLTDYHLIIEVMGDFWHANPLKYAFIKYPQQKKSVERDRRKHTYIKNHMNIEVLYLWEDDIIHRPDICESLIIEYIMNDGHLPNYHSFNWELCEGLMQIKKELVIPHQDYEKTPTAA